MFKAREYLTENQIKYEIEPTLLWLQTLKYPSGNFPSSVGSKNDRLVHWCHGAPSMTMLFCLAFEVIKTPYKKYFSCIKFIRKFYFYILKNKRNKIKT